MRLVASFAALLLLAACSSSPASSDVAAPDGVSVSVLQYRSDYSIRRLEIKVRNDGSAPITVSGAQVTSQNYASPATWVSTGPDDDAVIGPGEATDLPAPLPATATCTPVAAATSLTATIAPTPIISTARLTLRRADGTLRHTTSLATTDPFSVMAEVHAQDCLERSATAVAAIRLLEPLRIAGKKAFLDISLTPTGRPGTLTIESVAATTLLDPPEGTQWTIDRTVSASSGPQTVSLELQPARCDPHAIAEDKIGTVMRLNLHVNNDPTGEVDYPSSTPLKAAIQNWVIKTCHEADKAG